MVVENLSIRFIDHNFDKVLGVGLGGILVVGEGLGIIGLCLTDWVVNCILGEKTIFMVRGIVGSEGVCIF